MKFSMRLGFFCVIMSFVSCNKDHIKGDGSVVTETRTVGTFTAIHSSGGSKVYITQGAQFNVQVKGYGNLLPYYETKVVNNQLKVGFKNNVSVRNDNTEVFITLPVLESIILSGSSEISTTGAFPAVTDFNATIAGSGSIQFSDGTAQNLRTSISGSGNIYMFGMLADNVETSTSGSGNTEVSAAGHLKVKISGSGNVYYKGTPLIVTNISGSGAVIPK